MPIDYWLDKKHDIVVTRVTGLMTDEEIVSYMSRLIEDTSWPSGMNGYVDARGISGFEVTSAGIEKARKLGVTGEHRFSGSRWVIVTDQDAVFGMTRMYELTRNPETYQVCVFRHDEDALDWLGLDSPVDLAPRPQAGRLEPTG